MCRVAYVCVCGLVNDIASTCCCSPSFGFRKAENVFKIYALCLSPIHSTVCGLLLWLSLLHLFHSIVVINLRTHKPVTVESNYVLYPTLDEKKRIFHSFRVQLFIIFLYAR